MGRILIIVGGLMVAAAIVFTPFVFADDRLQTLADYDAEVWLADVEARICRAGERLEDANGRLRPDASGAFQASGLVYCVNSETGARREVTEVFLGEMVALLGIALPALALVCGLCGLGLLLVFFGLIAASRGAARQTVTIPAGTGTVPAAGRGTSVGVGMTARASNWEDPFAQPRPAAVDAVAETGTIPERLRNLEDLRSAGLISAEEYTRKREEILRDL